MTNPEEELARLVEVTKTLPKVDAASADFTVGYLNGYREGLRNTFVVACAHNDDTTVEALKQEYVTTVGLIYVALLAMNQADEADRELIKKHQDILARVKGGAMWEVDIVNGSWRDVQDALMEGHFEREFQAPDWMDEAEPGGSDRG